MERCAFWGRTGFFAILAALVSMSVLHATDEWDRDRLDETVNQMRLEIDGRQASERLDGPAWEQALDRLKELAVDLANRTGAEAAWLFNEVVGGLKNIRGLGDRSSADLTYDRQEKTASLHYHLHIDEPVATELKLPEKWEVFELKATHPGSVAH
jgi:hypothetical protein